MNSLLVINSSGRIARSVTRQLAGRFVAGWKSHHPQGKLITRDVGLNPPPPVNEAWIAAAFPPNSHRTGAASKPLALSETLIDEVIRAEAIVLGVPMYNFGMPAQLKAYFDQIVRVGRTFAFDAGETEPYRPLLAPKPVVAILSVGDGSLLPGGALAHLNFLEPHLETLLTFIGLTDITFIRAGYDEYQDERAKRSLAAAGAAIDRTLDRLRRLSRSVNPSLQTVSTRDAISS
ncbi:MAG: NAD(P)H-dependent oxidoreductase [Terrimicrobiaceae bacterium]